MIQGLTHFYPLVQQQEDGWGLEISDLAYGGFVMQM